MFLLIANGLLFVALLFVARAASARVSRRTRIVVACILALVSLPATAYTLYYFHLFDDWRWFYQARSYPVTNFYPALLGGLVGWLLPAIPGFRFRARAVFVALLFVAIPFLKPAVVPLRPADLQDRWRDGVCLQSTPSTCGPASAATLLTSVFGDPVDERTIAAASHSSARGTEIWYLAQFLRGRGYEVTFHTDAPNPVPHSVAGTRVGRIGHFVAVLDGVPCRVADPLTGPVPAADLGDYAFTGFYMQIDKAGEVASPLPGRAGNSGRYAERIGTLDDH